jgi:hypothetical protein
MNQRHRLTKLYRHLPWYDRAELYFRARLRTWPFVERRRQIQPYHLVGNRRQASLPLNLVLIHFLVTLITWQLLPHTVTPWFLPIVWSASLATTAFLYLFLTRLKRFPFTLVG